MYENDGEMNDAFIAYRNSLAIYKKDYLPTYGTQPPSLLLENLYWSAEAMGFKDEAEKAAAELGRKPSMHWSGRKENASIVFIHYNGRGPRKVEKSFTFPMPDGKPNRIALPVFKESKPLVAYARVRVKDMTSGKIYFENTQLMENISAIAVLNLDNERVRLIARAIIRAAIQYGLSEAASEGAKEAVGGKDGETVGQIVSLLAGVARTIVAAADLRQWQLLPAEIRVARLVVPSGVYQVDVEYVNSYNQVVWTKNHGQVRIQRGEDEFVFLESIQ